MSNQKPATKDDAGKAPDEGTNAPSDSARLAKVNVLPLEIDDKFDGGSDPYNRTGSHYVADLRRLEEKEE